MSPAPALEIASLYAGYRDKPVVCDVTFSIADGELFGLIGLNGAGKTTIIKTILGLRRPNAGAIKIYGRTHGTKHSKEQLAYLPERFEPPWFLSGKEFVQFSCRLYGKDVTDDQMHQMALLLGLDPGVLGKKVHTYSKGMRQKLGLIGTILPGTPLLILDEPMSGLDPLARAQVKTLLKGCMQDGRTILMSSHILEEMDSLCDRVAILNNGILPYFGTPGELKTEYGDVSLEKAFLHVIGQQEAVA